MSQDHSFNTGIDNKLKVGLFLNTGFTIFEFAVGIFSGSLALLSDAGHNLTDSLSLLIVFFAQKIAKKEANVDHSYGYGRATILAAFINGLILVLLALYIFYEAWGRIMQPEHVAGSLVAGVAFVGIVVNTSIALLFRKEQDSMHIKSAYINMFFDALASVGALLAGVLIILTKQTIFDSLISILIGILLLRSSWEVVRDAMHVLLEGVPSGINTKKVKEVILGNSLVKHVDDLHIWAISSQYAALSCHVVIEDCDLEKSTQLVKEIKQELQKKCNIEHATIETELKECPPDNN